MLVMAQTERNVLFFKCVERMPTVNLYFSAVFHAFQKAMDFSVVFHLCYVEVVWTWVAAQGTSCDNRWRHPRNQCIWGCYSFFVCPCQNKVLFLAPCWTTFLKDVQDFHRRFCQNEGFKAPEGLDQSTGNTPRNCGGTQLLQKGNVKLVLFFQNQKFGWISVGQHNPSLDEHFSFCPRTMLG